MGVEGVAGVELGDSDIPDLLMGGTSGSPNQKGSTPGLPTAAFAMSRIFEDRNARTRVRAWRSTAVSDGRS